MLLLLITLPLLGCIIITFINNKAKEVSLITSIITMLLTIILWIKWDNNNEHYEIIEKWSSIINLGIDGISLVFILLTVFIIPISIIVAWNNINTGIFYILILLLESILIAVFLVLDLIPFYICFESSLIPMFLLIGIYGNRERKIYAAYKIFLMTLTGSLFMLIAMLSIYSSIGSNEYIIIQTFEISKERQNFLWLAFLIAFAIKTPIVPFHTWLIEAHTEAPLSGSILLAGILLKLASYGFIRLSLGLLPNSSIYFTPLVYTLCTISIIYSSLSTLRQIDLKKIIAYSSIGHMCIITMGLFSNSNIGIEGATLLGVAHGIVSPALFICVGVLYDRYHTRIMKYYRGLTIFMPLFSLFLFLFTLANIATPLTANFIGELLCLTSSFQKNPLLTILAAIGIILTASYSIWLYNRICFGNQSLYIKRILPYPLWGFSSKGRRTNINNYILGDLIRIEFFILLPLFIVIFVIGIYPNLIIDIVKLPISNYII